jgi:hypothetical protein
MRPIGGRLFHWDSTSLTESAGEVYIYVRAGGGGKDQRLKWRLGRNRARGIVAAMGPDPVVQQVVTS